MRHTDPPRPACYGESSLFWALIDYPKRVDLRQDAAKFCGSCPLAATCLPAHLAMGGDDARWAHGVTRELARQRKKASA